MVFIGPYIARKAEAKDEKVTGVIDAVLTFPELKVMFVARGITPKSEEEGQFSGPKANLGRLCAVSEGLLRVARFSNDILANEIINARGKDYMPHILREVAEGKTTAKLINLCFCEGCIDGPVIGDELSVFKRREIITDYTKSEADPAQTERDIRQYAGIDLSRKFTNQNVALPQYQLRV